MRRVILDEEVSLPSSNEVGCEFCPLNKVPGIHKIKGEVHGREVFIWGMAPGPQENIAGQEFVGPSGELLWQELGLVGITRLMCDIQNTVRCFPANRDEDRMIPPVEDAESHSERNPLLFNLHKASIGKIQGQGAPGLW